MILKIEFRDSARIKRLPMLESRTPAGHNAKTPRFRAETHERLPLNQRQSFAASVVYRPTCHDMKETTRFARCDSQQAPWYLHIVIGKTSIGVDVLSAKTRELTNPISAAKKTLRDMLEVRHNGRACPVGTLDKIY